MSVHLLTSVCGAPGATTTAIAWATLTDQTTLLLEADMTGGSPVLAGPFRGQVRPDRTVLNLAEYPPTEIAAQLWWSAIPLPDTDDHRVLPTITNPAQARALAGAWPDIADAIRATARQTGATILIDYGRLSTQGAARLLLDIADTILVLTAGTMAATNSTRRTVEQLYTELAATGLPQRLAIVPVLPQAALGRRRSGLAARPWGPGEMAQAFAIPSSEPGRTIQIPLLTPVAYDPDAAAVYSAGVIAPRGAKPYTSSVLELASAAEDLAEQIRSLTAEESPA